MRILLTGGSGYIGKRLLPLLLQEGHEVYLLTRLFVPQIPPIFKDKVHVLIGDLLGTLPKLPEKIDVAYFLVHSMKEQPEFEELETKTTQAFLQWLEGSSCRQIIYLSGLIPKTEEPLSKHLRSRKHVEEVLRSGNIPVTTLRTGIVIGSGSASFELIRDLVEKLPIMIAPKWVYHRCDVIAVHDILFYLKSVLLLNETLGKTFEISNGETFCFIDLLKQYASFRKLSRKIIPVPFLTPHLSSYWLYFVTSIDFYLASALVEGLKHSFIATDHTLEKLFPDHTMISYQEALERAFARIEADAVVSSWKDHFGKLTIQKELLDFASIPKFGCFVQEKSAPFPRELKQNVIDVIFSIGGKNGWYYLNFLWKIRGFIDRMLGGSGLRRGRKSQTKLETGDALDFWRVLLADPENGRLLLYAEMILPGEAWIEWSIFQQLTGQMRLVQRASFRPKGIWGRIYWWALWPVHIFIFKGLINKIIKIAKQS